MLQILNIMAYTNHMRAMAKVRAPKTAMHARQLNKAAGAVVHLMGAFSDDKKALTLLRGEATEGEAAVEVDVL